MKEMVGGCCVCSDDRGWPENPLVYCDGQACTVAVHQACYGIVTVPTGPWYCRKCESQERTARVKCELCPSKYGALKRTDNSGWAHVVCALYIPEVRFGNVTTMEPIQLQLIPAERFSKVCYICKEQGKPANANVGACMQCNKAGCKQQFHVTCAQGMGLLCEEAGNFLDNVKYCGYCQYHYSKLKKGGNVKTIPPYKPVSAEHHLSDSNSEKDADPTSSAKAPPTAPNPSHPPPTPPTSSTSSSSSSSKRSSNNSGSGSTGKAPSSSSGRSSSSSTSRSSAPMSTSSSSHPKSKNADKERPRSSTSTPKPPKPEETPLIVPVDATIETKTDRVTPSTIDRTAVPVKEVKNEDGDLTKPEPMKVEVRESKPVKKRRHNSRTPTPVTVVPPVETAVVTLIAEHHVEEKRDATGAPHTDDKSKKVKAEHPSPVLPGPHSATPPTATSTVKATTPPMPAATPPAPPTAPPTAPSTSSAGCSPPQPLINSLVVSVPLLNANLSPHAHLATTQPNVLTPLAGFASAQPERTNSTPSNSSSSTITGSSSGGGNGSIITSELSGGGLKITYEKQVMGNYQVDLERITPPEQEAHTKRSRSMSNDKCERAGRSRKRANTSNAHVSSFGSTSSGKRVGRPPSSSSHTTPPPQPASVIIPANQIKESPPSSPSSESQDLASGSSMRTRKGRKGAPAAVPSSSSTSSKDSKESIKVFQNGIIAPHMMGNQLNPNSNMAQKMTDHLNSELEAHSIFNAGDQNNMIGPQLHQRVLASARSSSTGGSSTASGASGFSMLGGSGGNIPQTLDQLLERQWEQGSQFLMEQAQHFDIASLLSCLHQLRAENLRLEEHVSSLLQRRDHLLAVNARLAIPLTGQPVAAQPPHSHTVNNIHPAVVSTHSDRPRSRHGSGYPLPQGSGPHPTVAAVVENGLHSDPGPNYSHSHSRSRSPGSGGSSQSQTSASLR